MDTLKCAIEGRSQAHGRNGWFVPKRAVVLDFDAVGDYPREFVLEIWSGSTIANHPPIMLRLVEDDAVRLVSLLQQGLEQFQATKGGDACEPTRC